MNKLKVFFGYLWAVSAFAVLLATFFGNSYFSRVLASGTGVKVSPRYSGGDIIRTIDHGTYQTHIHRPVFDGLIGERRDGFIQISWEPLVGLPIVVKDEVSLSADNKKDFLIILDTRSGKAALQSFNTSVLSIEKIYKLQNGWSVRISLRKLLQS